MIYKMKIAERIIYFMVCFFNVFSINIIAFSVYREAGDVLTLKYIHDHIDSMAPFFMMSVFLIMTYAATFRKGAFILAYLLTFIAAIVLNATSV